MGFSHKTIRWEDRRISSRLHFLKKIEISSAALAPLLRPRIGPQWLSEPRQLHLYENVIGESFQGEKARTDWLEVAVGPQSRLQTVFLSMGERKVGQSEADAFAVL